MNKFPNGRIWLVLIVFHKKYRGDSLLDKIQLNKDMLIIVQNPGEHPDKQFNRAYRILSNYSHKTVRPTHEDLIAQIVVGSFNPYTVAYT